MARRLQTRLTDTVAECNRLRSDTDTLRAENNQLHQQNKELSVKAHNQEISSYEALLSEAMGQYDRLHDGILALTQRLYGSLGQDFVPENKGEACLCDLEHAIFVNMNTKQTRK